MMSRGPNFTVGLGLLGALKLQGGPIIRNIWAWGPQFYCKIGAQGLHLKGALILHDASTWHFVFPVKVDN